MARANIPNRREPGHEDGCREGERQKLALRGKARPLPPPALDMLKHHRSQHREAEQDADRLQLISHFGVRVDQGGAVDLILQRLAAVRREQRSDQRDDGERRGRTGKGRARRDEPRTAARGCPEAGSE